MSNTVKTTKSDEMLKSLAAQIASQSVGIFFQMKEEARHEEIIRIETVDSLMVRIEDLEQDIAEKNDELFNRNNTLADLTKKLEETSRDRDRMEKWWHDELCINRELHNEIEKLREKVPVEALDEMEEEKEAVNG